MMEQELLEKQRLMVYLITQDESHLPENFPVVDLKKLQKKTLLQRARIIKRLSTECINIIKVATEMRESESSTNDFINYYKYLKPQQ